MTTLTVVKDVRDLETDLIGEQDLDKDGLAKLNQFKDLLDKMTMLDPAKRITCSDAIKHPFIVEK